MVKSHNPSLNYLKPLQREMKSAPRDRSQRRLAEKQKKKETQQKKEKKKNRTKKLEEAMNSMQTELKDAHQTIKQQQVLLEKIQTEMTRMRTVNERDNITTTSLPKRAGLTTEEIAQIEKRNRRQSTGSSRAIKMEFERTSSGDFVNTLTTPHNREQQKEEIKTGDMRDEFFHREYESGIQPGTPANREVAGINRRETHLKNLQESMEKPLSSARRNVGSIQTFNKATTPPPATPPPPATTPPQANPFAGPRRRTRTRLQTKSGGVSRNKKKRTRRRTKRIR